MILVGDIHGDYSRVIEVAEENPNETVVQVGDFFGGFEHTTQERDLFSTLPSNLRFFRGNHDSPDLCKSVPNFLGEFGEFEDAFFVSGADSYDKEYRKSRNEWFENEELSYAQGQECLALWEKSNAQVLLTHDCPQFIVENFKLIYDKTRTRQLLSALIEVRKPKILVFGHWHNSLRVEVDGVKYVGLGMGEDYKIDEKNP